jgi:hypothetical protein
MLKSYSLGLHEEYSKLMKLRDFNLRWLIVFFF